MMTRQLWQRTALLAAALSAAGCGLLDVSNPGPTEDSQLDNPGAVSGIVAGMSAAMSDALNYLIEMDGVVSGELAFSGSFGNFGGVNGIVSPEDENSTWSRVQQARITAEEGITRMQATLGDGYASSAYAARANVLAGVANRFIGESYCNAVIDGGPLLDRTTAFERAEQYFTDAIAIGTAVGNDDYVTAAYGGRAEVRADLGRWTEAIADAAHVPTEFEYDALFSADNSSLNNAVNYDTHKVYSFTVAGTPRASITNDPRTPWDTVHASDGSVQKGADGVSPVYRQRKYPSLDSPIPLVKGAALRTLEAEAALLNSDVAGAVAAINQERSFYGLSSIHPGISLDSAWALLRNERSAVTWLEGRHLWDESRWFAATGTAHDDFMRDRSLCLPVSQDEIDANPNIP